MNGEQQKQALDLVLTVTQLIAAAEAARQKANAFAIEAGITQAEIDDATARFLKEYPDPQGTPV